MGADLSRFIVGAYESTHGNPGTISAGILLKETTPLAEALRLYHQHQGHMPVFVHAGFTEAKALKDALGDLLAASKHVFVEPHCGKLYRKHFEGGTRILLRDGFIPRRNADYPPVESFSELHVTFKDDELDGFGDFLIVGDDYSETGGPAHAVALHLTFIDPAKDNAMYVYHFVSTTQGTPTDPAGKFAEALQKLVNKANTKNSKLLETSALKRFREFHAMGHFPGLGFVKKLSMLHHIETLAEYHQNHV